MPSNSIISISHLHPVLDNYYALAALARIWTRKGFDVRVGQDYDPAANICILHHDRTRQDAAPPAPANAVHLNARVLDISKRLFSSISLDPNSNWSGPVIIKTNGNHFGIPDTWDKRRPFLTKIRTRLRHVSWRAARMLPPEDYPILDSIADVPSWVWRDPALIVEKFLPERTEDGLYSMRGWMFFGNKGYGYRLFSPHPLVKVGTMKRYEIIDEVPHELTAMRSKLAFDFGKFDYVVHDGRAIIFDVNKTPGFADDSDEETPRLRDLADGIEAYLL